MKLNKKYVSVPRHAFDLKAQREIAHGVNALRNMTLVQGSGIGKVHLSESNTVIELPAQPASDIIFPFRIYHIKNVSATQDQIAQFTTSSLGLNISDFTFQIRNGLISYRPLYANLTSESTGGLDGMNGSYEVFQYGSTTDLAPEGYDSEEDFYYPIIPNEASTVILDNTADTLISDGGEYSSHSQIALNPQVEDSTNPTFEWAASFWFKIIDLPNQNLGANLMGRMYSTEPAPDSGRTVIPFPIGPDIIPLGTVQCYYNSQNNSGSISQFVTQIQTGNCVNRFSYGAMRGRWTELYAAIPAGGSNINWYPGDSVVDDTDLVTDGVSGFSFYKIYQFISTPSPYNVGTVPSSDPTHWQAVGISE